MTLAASPAKPRILIVEDSYLTASAVCEMVIRRGCDVAGTVGRVEAGLQFVREHTVDGAVVDIDLHGTPSFPICEQLRKRDIPFVFLTGYDKPYLVPEEFRTAPWLRKPVSDREFDKALEVLARASATDSERGNDVLKQLAAADWLALQPHLEHLSLTAGQILIARGGEVPHLYFPTTALISVSACSTHGKAIEVALVGRDGIAGIGPLLGQRHSRELESMVHVSGMTWRVATRELVPLLEKSPGLRSTLLSAVHDFLGQVSSSAVSIGSTTIEQRLARRLMMMSVRLGSRQLALTHEALARLMAVRRSGITVALHMLEARRLIRSRRNLVEILDDEGLARAAGDAQPAPGGGGKPLAH